MSKENKQLNRELDQLRKAQVLLDSPHSRENGCSLLRELSLSATHISTQTKAAMLLAKHCNQDKKPQKVEFEPLSAEISGLASLSSTRLLGLIAKLRANSVLAIQKRSEFVTRMKQLINKELKNEEFNEDQINQFSNVIRMIREIEPYAVDLYQELEALNLMIRKDEFNKRIGRIEKALLEAGDVEGSWEFIERYHEIENLPVEIKEAIEKLTNQTGEVRDATLQYENLLKRRDLLGEIKSWIHCKEIIRYFSEIEQTLNLKRLTLEQEFELSRMADKASEIVHEFLVKRAENVLTLAQMKEFWSEYSESVRSPEIPDSFDVPENSFKNFETAFLKEVKTNIRNISGVDELNKYQTGLKKEIAELSVKPYPIVRVVEEIDAFGQAWEDLENTGKIFEAPSFLLSLPLEFTVKQAEFEKLSQELESENEKLRRALEENDEDALQKIVAKVEKLLAINPQHVEAAKLKTDAAQALIGYQIERAVSRWNLNELKALISSPSDKTFWYEKNFEILGKLKKLGEQPVFDDWKVAGQWWDKWREERRSLLMKVPAAVQNVLDAREHERLEKWIGILDEFVNTEHKPEEYEKVALSLAAEAKRNDIVQSYKEILSRKSQVAKISEKIAEKNWKAARRLLEDLDNSPEKQRLNLILEVDEAAEASTEKLSLLLAEKWTQIQNNYGESEVLLLETFTGAWEENKYDIIRNHLVPLIDRVTSKNEPTEHKPVLERWRNWFSLEEKARSGKVLEVLPELYRYAKEPASTEWHRKLLQKQKVRLIHYWELEYQSGQESFLVPLVWAHFVWGENLASDNLYRLMQGTEALRERVDETLRSDGNLSHEQVNDLLNELKNRYDIFTQTGKVLELSGNQSGKLVPPAELAQSIAAVEMLSKAIETLEKSNEIDLREPLARDDFEEAETNLRVNFSGEIKIRTKLLAECTRLEPLTKLAVIEKHIKDFSINCGSDDLWMKDNLFASVRQELLALKQRFKSADLLGGYMWQKLSAEYCDFIFKKGCLLIPKPVGKDIDELIDLLADVGKREKVFRKRIKDMWRERPAIGEVSRFKLKEHQEYFDKFPKEAPASRRDYIFFEKVFAGLDVGKKLLEAARQQLPNWIKDYMKTGVPECGDTQ